MRIRVLMCLIATLLLAPIGVGDAQQSKTPQQSKVPVGVRQKVQRSGVARVGVRLNLPIKLGRLSPEAESAQERAIAASQDNLLASLAGTKYRVTGRLKSVPGIGLEAGADVVDALERSPLVSSVADDGLLIKPSLEQSVQIVEADKAWAATPSADGTGWVVAILDTGVDKTHPFLAGRVVAEACFSGGANCPGGATQMIGPGAGVPCTFFPEECKHGTHVAGIAAGQGSPGFPFPGVAKGAQLIAVQVFSRSTDPAICGSEPPPCIVAYPMDLALALNHVYSLQATYQLASINMSLGGGAYTEYCDTADANMTDIIGRLKLAGIATVVASANFFYRNAMAWPACISTAISVGSTTKTDMVSDFSNSAPFLSLSAPGSDIKSSVPPGPSAPDGFAFKSGTSQAAPHVAGAWAILKQRFPTATVLQVQAALQMTAFLIMDNRDTSPTYNPQNHTTQCRIRIFMAMGYLGQIFATPPTPYAMFDATGASPDLSRQGTLAFGISDCGYVVGKFQDDSAKDHGFMEDPDGVFTTIDYPGADHTEARGINNVGQIAGSYQVAGRTHGFVRNLTTPTASFASFDVPGAVDTYAYGINNAGQIVGYCHCTASTNRGFVRNPNGAFTLFEVQGTSGWTFAFGINNIGQVVGSFRFSGFGADHGFLRNPNGTSFTTIDVPGADLGTAALGINDEGWIVGYYNNSREVGTRGFVRSPDGTITTFAPPPPNEVDPWHHTSANGINKTGQIVGWAMELISYSHGYLFRR